jgi:predicted  nucleic acid-binding Zn-ribbon protein
VNETLSMLLELQQIDDALQDLSALKNQLELIRRENAQAIKVFDEMLADRGIRLAEVRSLCEAKEADIKETEANIGRSRQRLATISNQRELQAATRELETNRRTNQQRNEELVKLLEQLESAEADQRRRQKERDELMAEMQATEVDLVRRIEEREAGVSELTGRRKALMGRLPPDLVGRYNRISKARNGVAVVVVAAPTCKACHMSISPQVFIRLQRMETLEACTNCNRFLIYRPGPEETQVGLSE